MLALLLRKLYSLLPQKVRQIFGFLGRHRSATVVFIGAVFVGLIFVASPVSAIGDLSVDALINGLLTWIADIFLIFAKIFIALAVFALKYFIEVAAYNSHTLSPTVILGWTMVRDVANMFFVVILLVIAFATILGIENFEWKRLTIKLVGAAILVNFSKLIAGVIIDAAHVFTITFLNAIALTAGGNLINMFKLDTMMSFISGATVGEAAQDNYHLLLVGGAFMAMMFAFIAFITIAAYTVIMVIRMVVLWILVILSPLAYLLSILPSTKQMAGEYWQEFTKYIIVAPIMVFFLWLAFATMGDGQINSRHVAVEANNNVAGVGINNDQGNELGDLNASLNKVTTWDNMANFFIAVGFLLVGLQRVQKLGVMGGGLAGSAITQSKKFASYASGARAAAFLGRGAGRAAKRGALGAGKFALAKVPVVGGDSWKRRGQTVAGYAKIGAAQFAATRARGARKLEDYAAKKVEGRGKVAKFFTKKATRLVTGTFEGVHRKRKRVSDLQKAATMAEELRDDNMQNSNSRSGRLKLRMSVNVEQQNRLSSAKRATKMAREREALKSGKNPDWVGWGNYAEREGIIAKTQAESEIRDKQLTRVDNLEKAAQRGTQLRAQGKDVEAAAVEKSAYTNLHEEEQKIIKTLGFNDRKFLGGQIATKLSDSSTPPEQKQQLMKDAIQLLDVSAADGSEQFDAVRNEMLQVVHSVANGGTGNFEIDDEFSSVRTLEAITGKRISGHSGFSSAENDLKDTFYNHDDARAMFASMSSSVKRLGADGNNRDSGSLVELEADNALKARGVTTDVRFYNPYDHASRPAGQYASEKDNHDKTQEYIGTRAKLKDLPNLKGFMNSSIDSGGNEIVTQIPQKQADYIKSLISNFSTTQKMTTAFNIKFAAGMNPSGYSNGAKIDMGHLLEDVRQEYDGRGDLAIFKKMMQTQFKSMVAELKSMGGTDLLR